MFPQFPQFPQLLQCRATQVLVALHTMKKADNYLKNGGKFIKSLHSSAVSAVSAVGFTEYKKHSFECFLANNYKSCKADKIITSSLSNICE